MSRLLVYVMIADTGKAPEINGNLCILEKCNPKIVKSAEVGDWIIGIGGVKLSRKCNKPDSHYDRKLIYAMKVESENPPKSKYFTHFGTEAIPIESFKELVGVKSTKYRTKYIRNNPKLYQKFDDFMNSKPRGKIGKYCCEVSDMRDNHEKKQKNCTRGSQSCCRRY